MIDILLPIMSDLKCQNQIILSHVEFDSAQYFKENNQFGWLIIYKTYRVATDK